jgi:IMP dehydrogenase
VPIQQKIEWIQKFPRAFISVGVNAQEEYKQLAKAGCNKFCIDIAHGHSQQMIDSIKEIYRITDGKADIIAGNVCTPEGFYALAEAGANIIKVGIGPGAACTTRMMTAVGIPQFSAIMNCMPTKEFITARDSRKVYMIADGGIKHPRDACLAIAAGADAVMMGSEFVRTVESAAEKTTRDGHIWARYRGQASTEFMTEYFGSNKIRQPEGVAFDVKITKSANDVFDYYEGGLRSSLTYLGSSNICNYQQTAEFFESTSSYINESNSRPQ